MKRFLVTLTVLFFVIINVFFITEEAKAATEQAYRMSVWADGCGYTVACYLPGNDCSYLPPISFCY